MRRSFGVAALLLVSSALAVPQDLSTSTPSASTSAADTDEFAERVVDGLLRNLRQGLEGRLDRLFLSSFSSERMSGYLGFKDQVQQFLGAYDAFRVHYRIVQSRVEGTHASAIVEFQMEAIPVAGNGTPMRREQQIQLELERSKKGWKIVDLRPREFFAP